MTLLDTLRRPFSRKASAATAVPYPGAQGWGVLSALLPGTKIDYAVEAGDAWDNSIVAALIQWSARTFPEAPPVLMRTTSGAETTDTTISDHEVLTLLDEPQPGMTGDALWMATLLSYIVDGNAYWLIERAGSGRPAQLRYLPHFDVTPKWPSDGSAFISHYEYRVNGRAYPLPVEDVIAFCCGADPRNPRMGIGYVRSALREIVGDNRASTFTAAILRGAVPGLMVYPKGDATLDEAGRVAVKKALEENFSGDNAGRVAVFSTEMVAAGVGYSPEQIMLPTMREQFEARLCALVGINPVVLGLAVGMRFSTYNNQQEAQRAAYEKFLIPLKSYFARVLTARLLREFSPDKALRVDWDYSRVRCLQEDQDRLATRLGGLVRDGVVSINEARKTLGQPAVPGEEYQAPMPLTVRSVREKQKEAPAVDKAARVLAAFKRGAGDYNGVGR